MNRDNDENTEWTKEFTDDMAYIDTIKSLVNRTTRLLSEHDLATVQHPLSVLLVNCQIIETGSPDKGKILSDPWDQVQKDHSESIGSFEHRLAEYKVLITFLFNSKLLLTRIKKDSIGGGI